MADINSKRKLFPFGNDDDEGFLVVDCDDESVYEYDVSEGLGVQIALSFSDFLEQYRNMLLADQFEYIEEMGLVEKTSFISRERDDDDEEEEKTATRAPTTSAASGGRGHHK